MVEPVTDVEALIDFLNDGLSPWLHLRKLPTTAQKVDQAATALRTLQERVTSLERVNAALNDTIDHLENVVAEWRGDRTT